MARSLVYLNPFLYEAAMVALYGRHYGARYRAVADLVPEGSHVLDVCCGPGILYDRYLRARGVTYTGLDVNARFVARVTRQGGNGLVCDAHDGRPLPPADVVVMHASLYQFLPDPASIVRRMLEAARERVIVAEPIRNLSSSRFKWLARFAGGQADAGLGDRPRRFDERALDEFFAPLGELITRSFLIPGGREKVYVLDPRIDRSVLPSAPASARPAPSEFDPEHEPKRADMGRP